MKFNFNKRVTTALLKVKNPTDDRIYTYTQGDKNFLKVWLSTYKPFFTNVTSSKSIIVANYCLFKMNKHNRIYAKIEEMADECDISKRTAQEAISQMKAYNLIKKEKNGIYFINPDWCFQGKWNTRIHYLKEYNDMEISKEHLNLLKKEKLKKECENKLLEMNLKEKKELEETFINSSIGVEAMIQFMVQQELNKKK